MTVSNIMDSLEAQTFAPKVQMNEKLLNIIANGNGSNLLGLPIPREEKQTQVQEEDNAIVQPEEILSSFPRRYATIEEVDEALYKTRTRFLSALTVTMLTELFLLAMTIAPFHSSGLTRALAHTLTNVNCWWKLTILARLAFSAILFVTSSNAYFAKAAHSKDWSTVCNVALGGMILELMITLLVKRLNIIAFVTRGLIAFYATTLASIVASTSNEYVAGAPITASA